jgi:putative transcriptional regulator
VQKVSQILLDICCDICYRIINMDQLAEKIKHCRDRKGWTQEQLARSLGVCLNTVQRWELGKTQPSPLAMEKLNGVLKDILEREQLLLL